LVLDPSTYFPAGAPTRALRATPGLRAFVNAREVLDWSSPLRTVDARISADLADEAAAKLPTAKPEPEIGFPEPEYVPRQADEAVVVDTLAPKWFTGGSQSSGHLMSILRGRQVPSARSVRLRSRRKLKGQTEQVRFTFDTDGLTGYIDTAPETGWADEIGGANKYTTNLVPNTDLQGLRARVRQIDIHEEIDPTTPMADELNRLVTEDGWNTVTRRFNQTQPDGTVTTRSTTSLYRPDQILPAGESRATPFIDQVDEATGEVTRVLRPGSDGLSAPLGNWTSTVTADLGPGTSLTFFDEVGQLRTRELFDRRPLVGVTNPDMLEELPAVGQVRVQLAADRLRGGVDTEAGAEQVRQAVITEEPQPAWNPRRDPGEFDEAAWEAKTTADADKYARNPRNQKRVRQERLDTLGQAWDNIEDGGGLGGLTDAEAKRYAETGELPVEWFINYHDDPAVLGGILDNGIETYSFTGQPGMSDIDLTNDVAFFDFLRQYGISPEDWAYKRSLGERVTIPKKPDITTRAQPKEIWVGRTFDDEGNIVNPGHKRVLTKRARKGANTKQWFRLEGHADGRAGDTAYDELYAGAAPTPEMRDAAKAEHDAARAAAAADPGGPPMYVAEAADTALPAGKGEAVSVEGALLPTARTAVLESERLDQVEGARAVAAIFKGTGKRGTARRGPNVAELADPDVSARLNEFLDQKIDVIAQRFAGRLDLPPSYERVLNEVIEATTADEQIRAWTRLQQVLPESAGDAQRRVAAALEEIKDHFIDAGYDAIRWTDSSGKDVFELLKPSQWKTAKIKRKVTQSPSTTVKDSWDSQRFGVKFSADQTQLYEQLRAIDVPLAKPQNWTGEQWAAWQGQRARMLDRGWVVEETPHGREVLRRPMTGEYDTRAAKDLDEAMMGGEIDDPARAELGLHDAGTRKVSIPAKFYEWVVSPQREPYFQRIADADDPEEIMKLVRGPQSKETYRLLLNAKTTQEVRDAFVELGGAQKIKELKMRGAGQEAIANVVDDVLHNTPGFRRGLDSVRLLHAMPGQYVNLQDADASFRTLHNWLISARVPKAQRKELLTKMLNQGTAYGRKEVYFDTFEVIRGVLEDNLRRAWTRAGNKDEAEIKKIARELTTLFEKDHAAEATYHVRDHEALGTVPGRVLSQSAEVDHSPQLLGDFFDTVLPLPSVRDIKRITSALGRARAAGLDLNRTKAVDGLIRGLDGYNTFFKVTALARIAYPVRVLMEEQGRLYGAGYPNIYTHPIQYVMSAVKGNKGRDLMGNPWKALGTDPNPNDYAEALINSRLMLDDDTSMKFLGREFRTVTEVDGDDYLRGWMFGLGKLHADPVARRIVGGFTPDELARMPQAVADGDQLGKVAWWMTNHPKGKEYLTALREASYKSLPDFSTQLRTADGVKKFVQDVTDQVTYMTAQNDPELVKVILNGRVRVGDDTVRMFGNPTEGLGGQVWNDGAFTRALRNYTRLDTKPPQVVTPTGIVTKSQVSAWNRATTQMFSFLNSRPSNYLSRSPVFRNEYWNRVAHYLSLADDQALETITASIKGEVLTGKQKRLFARAVKNRDAEHAHLTAGDIDQLAKSDALTTVRDLLYDTSDKTNFWDGMRLAAPFGAAWAEVLSTWTRIIADNPRVLDRVMHAIHGAQQEDSNILYDITNTAHPNDQGFFFKDLTTGDESFAWPMPAQAQRFLTWGINSQNPQTVFPAPVSGLNLIGQVQPGFGPIVTAPVQAVLGGVGEGWSEDVLNFIAPFGGPSPEAAGGIGNALIDSVTPAFMRKLLTSVYPATPAQKAQLASANLSSQVYLASTGDYDLGDPDDVLRLQENAQSMARRLFFLRGIAQFVLPTMGSPDQTAMTGNGELVMQAKLAELLRSYQSDPGEGGYGYQQGLLRFLRDFGKELYLMGVDKSDSTGFMAPTRNTYLWMRKNQDLVNKYPDTWGLLVENAGTEFYYPAYQAQVRQGNRTMIDPGDLVRLANERLGRALYTGYRDQVGDNPTESEAAELRQLQDKLELQFPGYDRIPTSLGGTGVKINELARAAKDDKVKGTPVGQALLTYFEARQQIRDQGISSLRTGEGRDLAPDLYYLGQQLAASNEAFGVAWDRLLSYEFDPAQFEDQEAAA
jgi:hypothetical protein